MGAEAWWRGDKNSRVIEFFLPSEKQTHPSSFNFYATIIRLNTVLDDVPRLYLNKALAPLGDVGSRVDEIASTRKVEASSKGNVQEVCQRDVRRAGR